MCSGAGSGPAIPSRDANENVFGRRFRIFDENVEIAVFAKHAGVDQLIFRIVACAPGVLSDQLRVGKCGLRIFVKVLSDRSW